MHRITIATTLLLAFMPAALATGPLSPIKNWDEQKAAHLLRRAGFGGTPDEIRRMADMGLDPAVDALLNFDATPQTDPDFMPARGLDGYEMRERMRDLPEDERKEVRQRLGPLYRYQAESMRAWWLRRMVVTPRPLEEKMTLFWHGHFTSGAREVENTTLLWNQNDFLRRHATGRFRDLLVGTSRDGAMLKYLDNISNKKRKPNENYARELMELFTMGEGRYTEQDVKEAARAFTGWTLGPDGFRVAERQHDRGVKTFLGQTGPLDGEDVIDIILREDATAEFMAAKLLRFFVISEPPKHWVRAVASELRRTDFDLHKTLRTLFRSELFYSDEAAFSLIKSPVELVVGSYRLLEASPDDAYGMAEACRDMGQDLFQPPNVKGWDGGRKWINTATLFARYNFSRRLLAKPDGRELRRRERQMGRMESGMAELEDHLEDYPGLELPPEQVKNQPQQAAAFMRLAKRGRPETAEEVTDLFIRRLLQRPLAPEQRATLLTVLGGGFHIQAPGATDRVRDLINVIMAMPEYQLN